MTKNQRENGIKKEKESEEELWNSLSINWKF